MQNLARLDQFVNQVKQVVLELGCHIISETLEECSLMLEESVKRRIHWQIKDYTQRTLLSSLGQVSFPHTRLSADAKASILTEAAQSSYRKAGESLAEPVSKETVMHAVHRVNIPKPEEDSKEGKCQCFLANTFPHFRRYDSL